MSWPAWVYVRRIRKGRMEEPKPARVWIRPIETRKPWSWQDVGLGR